MITSREALSRALIQELSATGLPTLFGYSGQNSV